MERRIINYWLLFWVNPFISLLLAIKDLNITKLKNMIWAFTIFFGLTFAVGLESRGSDITRYHKELVRLNNIKLDLNSGLDYFLSTGEVDIIRTVTIVIISRFTDNLNYLTLIFAIIFGFFYSRNISFVYNIVGDKFSNFNILLFITFSLFIPIWSLNGFRFWAAAHVFLYGLLPYIYQSDKKNLWALFLSPIFHFTFIIPASIFIIYKIFGNKLYLYFVLFILSIFYLEIGITEINSFLNQYLPSILWERSESYFNEQKVFDFQQKDLFGGINWYAVLYQKTITWFLIFVIIIIFIKFRKILVDKLELKSIFSFSLLFASFANIMAKFPSGGRFLTISTMLFLLCVIIYNANYDGINKIKWIRVLYNFIFLLFFIVTIRTGFYNFSLTTILGNPIIAFFTTEQNISLNDIIK